MVHLVNVPEFINDVYDTIPLNCCKFPISEIMKLDDNIRYVGVYHNHSGMANTEIRENISSYFPQEIPISTQETKLQVLQSKFAEKQLGQFQYAMARFDKALLYAFSINEHDLLLVKTDLTANSDVIISRILNFLRH